MFKFADAADTTELHEAVKNYRNTFIKYNNAKAKVSDEIAELNAEIAAKRKEIADKEASVNLTQLSSQINQYQKEVTSMMSVLGLKEYRYNDKIVSILTQVGKFTIAQEDLLHLTENVRRKDEELAVFLEDLFSGLADFKRTVGETTAFVFEDTVEKRKREEKEQKQKVKEPVKPRLTRTPEEYKQYVEPATDKYLQSSRITAGIIDWLKGLWSSVLGWWDSFANLFTDYSAMQEATEKELDAIIDKLEIVDSTEESAKADDSLFTEDFGSSSSSELPEPLV